MNTQEHLLEQSRAIDSLRADLIELATATAKQAEETANTLEQMAKTIQILTNKLNG